MKRFLMSIMVLGTAVALMAAPAFAGGSALSDSDLDTVYAGHGGGTDAEVELDNKSQQNLDALNNVNAAMSNVSGQTNIVGVFTHDASHNFIIQKNRSSISGDNGEKGDKAKIDLTDKSQQNLDALNNVNAAMSNVSNQTNVAAVFSYHGAHNFIIQSNRSSISGDNASGGRRR